MASRGLLSRASRIKTKLQSALEPILIEVQDVSYQHAGHAAVRETGANETHFNLKIVSSKFDGQNLVKRHRMVYDLLSDELQSGLHALSIVAKTPKENGIFAALEARVFRKQLLYLHEVGYYKYDHLLWRRDCSPPWESSSLEELVCQVPYGGNRTEPPILVPSKVTV